MKCRMITILLAVLLCSQVAAQVRTIEGRLTSAGDGEPLPGVNIIIKGTTTGTVTDIDGYYKISAPIGSTLVFSFVGMATREAVVTADYPPAEVNNKNRNQNPNQQQKQPTTTKSIPQWKQKLKLKPGRGVADLDQSADGYVIQKKHSFYDWQQEVNNYQRLNKVHAIRPRFSRKGKVWVIDTRQKGSVYMPVVEFSSTIAFDKVNRLPNLQSTFAQGRTNNGVFVWQGPETGEIFSWGPKIANLEFDGLEGYPYDINGRLVPLGNGNGRPPNVYDPTSIFRTATSTDHSVKLSVQVRNTNFGIGYQHQRQNSVIPGSGQVENNLNFKLKSSGEKLDVKFMTSLLDLDGNISNRGANLSSIVATALMTPSTFDNKNGSSILGTNAFRLNDGSQRSFSPLVVDNPLWLINTTPDQESVNRIISKIDLDYDLTKWLNITYRFGYDRQESESIFGQIPRSTQSPNGRLTNRDERHQAFVSELLVDFDDHFYPADLHIKGGVGHILNYNKRSLSRTDGFGFPTAYDLASADSLIVFNNNISRSQHQLLAYANLNYNDLVALNLTNTTYISSTLDGIRQQPSIGLAITPIDYNMDVVDMLKFYGSISRQIKEAPLIYPDWHHNTLRLNSEHTLGYFEDQELIFQQELLPEEVSKFETGLEIGLLNGRVHTEWSYYTTNTDNSIVPLFDGSTFNLRNVASLNSKGWDLSLSYGKYYGRFKHSSALSLNRERISVTKINDASSRIPITGFSDVSTNLIEGELYGAIVGSAFQRNEEGQLIIGEDGYPLVSNEQQVLGNIQPDWTLGWHNTVSWKHFRLSALIGVSNGGEVWNGTQNVLNYLGRSQASASERNIRDFIFDGVKEDGSVNNVPVNFSDPNQPIENNRWVRYGFTGVAEEAIEDASWVRLESLSLSYDLSRLVKDLKKAEITFTGRNLFLISGYNGVDPEGSLFGYNLASGLDLFNVPSTRSYAITLNIIP
ncbi:MAG: carboxypeptidase-like regulatory domain-containing protein [Bacteroidota bacterium]